MARRRTPTREEPTPPTPPPAPEQLTLALDAVIKRKLERLVLGALADLSPQKPRDLFDKVRKAITATEKAKIGAGEADDVDAGIDLAFDNLESKKLIQWDAGEEEWKITELGKEQQRKKNVKKVK